MNPSKSNRLRLGDIRRIHALVAQVRDLSEDPAAWRTAALAGLTEWVHGTVALTADLAVPPGADPVMLAPVDLGWETPAARQRFFAYLARSEFIEDPGTRAVLTVSRARRLATWTRSQYIEDACWYPSPAVSEARRFGNVNEFLCSTWRVNPQRLQGFVLYRPWGAAPFTTRCVRLVQLFHLSLLPLFPRADDVAALPPRLQQTLDLMCEGWNLKQIAREMDLSRHTVNDHAKRLHRLFGVSSRAELIARQRARRRVLRLP